MKYTRYAGYGVLLGTSVMMAGNMNVKAEENNRTPIPVEEQTVLKQDLSEETLIIEDSLTGIAFDEDEALIEETKTINEPILTTEQTVVNNGIPVIYLNIDESSGTIDAMNNDPDHNTLCYGTLDFTLPSPDFKYADLDTDLKEYYNLEMQVKGRGNSTWFDEKKPYKIKLDKKTDLLGLGSDEKNKHWVLIANAYDPTLLKNRITAYVGEQMDMEYTPLGVSVDLVMNDKYLGNYLLIEHIRVDKNRIDIDELTEDDTAEPDITGGYIVQNGNQESPDSPSYFVTESGLKWYNHTPSFDPEEGDYENDIQKNYIRNYMQLVEDILFSDSQIDDQGRPYSYYMDIPSAAKYWIIQAFSNNNDAYDTGSTYLYKKRDTQSGNGKLYWGPLWDFDLGWGITDMQDGGRVEGYDMFIRDWILPMLYDTSEDSFCRQILNEWPKLRSILLDMVEDNGLIDRYYEEINVSQAEDEKIYSMYQTLDYKSHITNLKAWIRRRAAWMDENLPNLPNEVHKIKVREEDKPEQVFYWRNNTDLSKLEHIEKEGLVFIGWLTEDGTYVAQDSPVTRDMILTPLYVTEEDATTYEEIYFQRNETSITFTPGIYYRIFYSVFPEKPQLKKIIWTSSDESIAVAEDTGFVEPLQTGSVTITATLPNGNSASLLLHILPQKLAPENVIIPESLIIKKGEHAPINLIINPANAGTDNIQFSTDAHDILKIESETGLVTGLAVGQAPVNVYVLYWSDVDFSRLEWRGICTVTVIEDDKQVSPPSNQSGIITEESLPYVNNQVHGVVTGVFTQIGLYIGWMVSAFLSIVVIVNKGKKK